MYIVHITPECSPAAKVGGLADVVYGLSGEMEIRGHLVEIILPKYDCMRYDQIWGLTPTFDDLWVPWYDGAIHCTVWFGLVHGRKCFFIEPHSEERFFERGLLYGHDDDPVRYTFFCKAALEFMIQSGKHPEIIHTHDWPTGMIPVLLYEQYEAGGMTHSRVCYTIHNFKHQGVTGEFLLHATQLGRPEYFMHPERLLDPKRPGALNIMKAGIVYSNFITTVSPKHAWEVRFEGQGCGLEETLHTHHLKVGGVLNGIDYSVWNPETDPFIPAHFNAEEIEPKYENKHALRERLMLEDTYTPIVAYVGRLDAQKGLDLVRHALFYCIDNGAQFVLLGSGSGAAATDEFLGLKHELNDHGGCHLEIGFDEELAHLIYAGAEMVLVPSLFEPCGLAQMIGMRYGTVPVVRSVGGLHDTVFDKDFADCPLEDRNGFVFHQPDIPGLESALGRAISLWHDYPEQWKAVMQQGMRYDFSWNHPGQHYLNIYELIAD